MRPGKVAILNYHRLVPDGTEERFHDLNFSRFHNQMQVLADRCVAVKHGAAQLRDGMIVYVTFDDGTEDHLPAGKLLADLGLEGVFLVVTDRLNEPGSLSGGDVSELSLMGHAIGSHTVTHAHLTELQPNSLERELVVSRSHLEDLIGTSVRWLAPPGGYVDRRVVEAATEAGYEVVRTMEWGYASQPPRGRVPALPVLSTYGDRAFEKLIEGNAPIWKYRSKQIVKRVLTEDRYVALRDGVTRVRRGLSRRS